MQILVNTDRHIEGSATLTDDVQTVVQWALGRFGDRITRVEVFLSDEDSSQKAAGPDKRCVIEARLGGLEPVTVSHQDTSVDRAVSGAAQKLEKTLKRTLGRKESLSKRRIRQRDQFAAVSPILEHDVKNGKQEDFIQVLRPLLGHLGQHARRELRIMEASGTLFPGQVLFGDLLDEVVTRAWLQFADRPRWLPLELWLTKILDQLLEEKIRDDQRAAAKRGDRLSEATSYDSPQVGEQEWWVWLLGEGDAVSPESEIASRQSAWAEEYLEAEELMDRIHEVLGDLPKAQRQAFVLHVLEAYELMEVAMVQDRPEAEVWSDILAARNHLRMRLSAGEQSETADRVEALAGSAEQA